MTESNLNIVLANVMCCLAQKGYDIANMYSVGNKCADEELLKLKILQDKFEALKCYNFSGDPINSEFESSPLGELENGLLETIISLLDDSTQEVTVNGVSYSLTPDGTSDLLTLVVLKLQDLNVYVDHNLPAGLLPVCTFTLTCNVTDFSFSITKDLDKVPYTVTYNFTNTVLGDCDGIDQVNCLTSEDMDKLAHDLMKECDICDCQLNQE